MRVYLDACVLSRLTDPPTGERVVLEAAAAMHLFQLILEESIQWSASTALAAELRNNPNLEKRADALELLSRADQSLRSTRYVAQRYRELRTVGFGAFDGLHVAFAEQAQCDVLLTTDDRFLRCALRNADMLKVEVANPLEWLRRMGLWRPQSN